MILVTGFEPFGGAKTNPTQTIVERFQALRLPQVVAHVLPTAFGRAETEVSKLIRQLNPTSTLMLGLNAAADTLRFEQVALNLDHANKSDNDGDVRSFSKIREDGPVGYWSGLPFEVLQASVSAFEETLNLSHDAGGFVCNHVFYVVSDLIAREFRQGRAGFIHVPPLDEPRLDRVVKLLRHWVDVLGQQDERR